MTPAGSRDGPRRSTRPTALPARCSRDGGFARGRARRAARVARHRLRVVHVRRPACGRLRGRLVAAAPPAGDGVLLRRRRRSRGGRVAGTTAPSRLPRAWAARPRSERARPRGARASWRDPAGQDAALQLYTSGTTGKPKGAVITHANLATQQELLAEAWGWRENDRLLHVLPLHHLHGLAIALLAAIGAGARPTSFPSTRGRCGKAMPRASVFMGVPTVHAKLLAALDAADEATKVRWTQGARLPRLITSGSRRAARHGRRALARDHGGVPAGAIRNDRNRGRRLEPARPRRQAARVGGAAAADGPHAHRRGRRARGGHRRALDRGSGASSRATRASPRRRATRS